MRQVSVNSLTIGDILGKTIFSSSGRVLLGKGVKLTPLYIAKLKDMEFPSSILKMIDLMMLL